MNWGSLFFSAEGRVGQKDFWLGVAILFVFGIVIHAAVGIGALLWLLSAYCWICLYAKRLHDMGRSAWTQTLPWLLGGLLVIAGMVMGVGGLIALVFGGFVHFVSGMMLGGLALGLGLFCLGGAMHLILLMWLGLSPGQTGPNRYGPEPGTAPFAPAT